MDNIISKNNKIREILVFISSMQFAIALLIIIAGLSIIGTIIPQDGMYYEYSKIFGKFWAKLLIWLGISTIYSSILFSITIIMLIISISICVCKQIIILIKNEPNYYQAKIDTFLSMPQQKQFLLPKYNMQLLVKKLTKILYSSGYYLKFYDYGSHQLAKISKGCYWGSLLTHSAILLICLGGLLEGNFWFLIRELYSITNQNSQNITDTTQLQSIKIPSFRGEIVLPEGKSTDFIFIKFRGNLIKQELPFYIELRNLNIDFYQNGQPKNFTSVIHITNKIDQDQKGFDTKIQVNQPLSYHGYSIYQSSFGDGGSILQIHAWPISALYKTLKLIGIVGQSIEDYNIVIENFQLINFITLDNGKMYNLGPSFTFKSKLHEYINYMLPVETNNRSFFISGMRNNSNEQFKYIFIPNFNGSPDLFFQFNAQLHNDAWLSTALSDSQINSMRIQLLKLFLVHGSSVLSQLATNNNIPISTSYAILYDTFKKLFGKMLTDIRLTGVNEDSFLKEIILTMEELPKYGMPIYLQLNNFRQIKASGLQINYSTYSGIVYLGFLTVIVGVLIIFFSPYRQFWIWLEEYNNSDILRLILTCNLNFKNQANLKREFHYLEKKLENNLQILKKSSN